MLSFYGETRITNNYGNEENKRIWKIRSDPYRTFNFRRIGIHENCVNQGERSPFVQRKTLV